MYSIITRLGSGDKNLLVNPDPVLLYIQSSFQSHQLFLKFSCHTRPPICPLTPVPHSFPVAMASNCSPANPSWTLNARVIFLKKNQFHVIPLYTVQPAYMPIEWYTKVIIDNGQESRKSQYAERRQRRIVGRRGEMEAGKKDLLGS